MRAVVSLAHFAEALREARNVFIHARCAGAVAGATCTVHCHCEAQHNVSCRG
jgi:hypothetical protein